MRGMVPATPMRAKTILIGALAYFILPLDFLPDFAPLIGFSDDAAVLALALKARFVNGSDLCDAEPSDETPAIDLGEPAPDDAAPGGARR